VSREASQHACAGDLTERARRAGLAGLVRDWSTRLADWGSLAALRGKIRCSILYAMRPKSARSWVRILASRHDCWLC
jgi:hypothetical protein